MSWCSELDTSDGKVSASSANPSVGPLTLIRSCGSKPPRVRALEMDFDVQNPTEADLWTFCWGLRRRLGVILRCFGPQRRLRRIPGDVLEAS